MNILTFVLVAAQISTTTLGLRTDAASNVFVLGAPCVVSVNGSQPQGSVHYLLETVDGKVVRSGDAGPTLTLLNLPVGWYSLSVTKGNESANVPIAVVYSVRRLPHGPVAVDAGSAWLVPPSQFRNAAKLLRLAGLGWIRERFAWRDVEQKRGKFNWGRYDACVAAESAQGLRIDDIFHDAPAWARRDHAINRFPDDLRDAYNFCRKLAKHYRNLVQTWEVWNEADGGFSIDNADEYAAFLKACYLGFKAGNPQVRVAQVSFANPASRYESELYQNGTQFYFDIYNYHEYLNPMDYTARAEGHFALLRRAGVVGKPVWVTEAGVNDGETGDELNLAQARVQSEFIPRSYAMSLASQTTRHFFFVFPHYNEPGVEWGVLTKGLLPYPGYSALAATAHFLGNATYLGEVPVPDDHRIVMQAFKQKSLGVAVIWRNGANHSFTIPSALKHAHFYNAVGTPITLPDSLGADPLFATCPLGPLRAAAKKLKIPEVPTGMAPPEPKLRLIVMRLNLPDNTIARQVFAYEMKARVTPFTLQIYNFSHKPFRGNVHLRIPSPWQVHVERTLVDVLQMGRTTLTGHITLPSNAGLHHVDLTGFVTLPAEPNITSSRIDLRCLPSPSILKSGMNLPIDRQLAWSANTSANGTTAISRAAADAVRFAFSFTGSADKWAYPMLDVSSLGDLSRFNAIALDYRTTDCGTGTIVRILLGKQNGSVYFTADGFPPAATWKHIVVPFTWLSYGTFSAPDPVGRLLGHHLVKVMVGINTKCTKAVLEIRNLSFKQLPQ